MRSAALIMLLAVALGCGTCQPVVIDRPVPYPDPVPYYVVPVLPPPPTCDAVTTCALEAPDRDRAQCATTNTTRRQACIAAWAQYGRDVEAAVAAASQSEAAFPDE